MEQRLERDAGDASERNPPPRGANPEELDEVAEALDVLIERAETGDDISGDLKEVADELDSLRPATVTSGRTYHARRRTAQAWARLEWPRYASRVDVARVTDANPVCTVLHNARFWARAPKRWAAAPAGVPDYWAAGPWPFVARLELERAASKRGEAPGYVYEPYDPDAPTDAPENWGRWHDPLHEYWEPLNLGDDRDPLNNLLRLMRGDFLKETAPTWRAAYLKESVWFLKSLIREDTILKPRRKRGLLTPKYQVTARELERRRLEPKGRPWGVPGEPLADWLEQTPLRDYRSETPQLSWAPTDAEAQWLRGRNLNWSAGWGRLGGGKYRPARVVKDRWNRKPDREEPIGDRAELEPLVAIFLDAGKPITKCPAFTTTAMLNKRKPGRPIDKDGPPNEDRLARKRRKDRERQRRRRAKTRILTATPGAEHARRRASRTPQFTPARMHSRDNQNAKPRATRKAT